MTPPNFLPATVSVTVKPETPYIEARGAARFLNFDFAIENLTDTPTLLESVEVSVRDRSDRLALRKFLDGNGTSPNIGTIPNREIGPHSAQLVPNPFHTWDAEVELAALRYRFEFSREGQDQPLLAEVTVSPVLYQPRTTLVLPVPGRMIIYDGHDFYAHHRRFNFLHPALQQLGFRSNFMRYAYDFCPVDDSGAMYTGDEARNEDWLGFGAALCAPAAGRVAALWDGMPDNRAFNEADIPTRPMVLFGNFIVIDHGNGEFSMLAHLMEGSIQVQVGEGVQQGQTLARIGASGSANIPHLHYELRTGTDTHTEGLPSYFHHFRRHLGAKQVEVEQGQVDTGDIVESLA